MRPGFGELRDGTGCVAAAGDGTLSIVPCPTAEPWRLDPDGTLHVGDRCIETLLFDGELVASDRCDPDPAHRFFLDDEGHLWTGAPPPYLAGGPLQCVGVLGGRPRASQCDAAHAPRWELTPDATVTPRPAGLPTGRAVRLADIDGDGHGDLCAVIAGALTCATGDGAGGFAAPASIANLAIEPESLALGDVDGDNAIDACGRDASGLLCATAGAGLVAERWSPAFARSGAPDAGDRSLTAVDADGNGSAEICGLSTGGVTCAEHDVGALPPIRSAWPVSKAPVWPGDLDGDRRADWCALSDGVAFCGLDELSPITTDGVPWSFSLSGIADPAPTDAALGALADVDGDGRADLCTVRGPAGAYRIECARSQGFGFGPLVVLGTLTSIETPTGLWLGDVDGDGVADACVDDGTSVSCVRCR
jgi:hypothetical protein